MGPDTVGALPDPVLVERLCGRPIDGCEPVRRGGNNRIYRVRAGGASFALKAYPFHDADKGARLAREFAAYAFLAGHGVDTAPAAIARDERNGYGLYQWIEGTPVGEPSADDITQAAAFARDLKRLSQAPDSAALPHAAECCLAASQLTGQIESRLSALGAVRGEHSGLKTFLDDHIVPAFAKLRDAMSREYRLRGFDVHAELAAEERTLSPSDFGFHNALRTPDGRLRFVDFEYFGWDDPVRLVSDFMLHPAMNLDRRHRKAFAAEAMPAFAADPKFRSRLELLFPLVAIRWCLILLNEFLPDRWARRAAAGHTDRDEALRRQLKKSQTMLGHALNGPGDLRL